MADEISTLPNTGDQMQRLKAAARELPQLTLPTSHFFAPGMYCRVVTRQKGDTIIGKTHRKAHFYIVARGAVGVVNVDGTRRILNPGDVVVSQPGTQRAVVALEDGTVCLTVHRTDNTDLDAIEAELIEPDDAALFDARNQPRAIEVSA
jgi:quercetin dioxygenase-like cupin family protein